MCEGGAELLTSARPLSPLHRSFQGFSGPDATGGMDPLADDWELFNRLAADALSVSERSRDTAVAAADISDLKPARSGLHEKAASRRHSM